jgi:transcriptional regulator with XRE-family HTH domain
MKNVEHWASNIRAEMARKQITLKDLAEEIRFKKNKPTVATVSRWVKGNCTLEVAHELERLIDNWEFRNKGLI